MTVRQRVLITGGLSGLGAALARAYVERGSHVLVTDVAPTPGLGMLPDPADGGSVDYLALDVRDDDAWAAAADWVEEHFGGLDLLVNNAGVAAGGRIDVMTMEEWEWIVSINLLGVVRGCRTFVPMFKAARAGRIVNIASAAGLVHMPFMASYNATKAGVVALSETLEHELAPYGVGVSVVCPSFFRTNLADSLRGSDIEVESGAERLITRSSRTADEVAARVVGEVDRGRHLVLTDPDGRAAYLTKRLVPALYRRLGQEVARRGPGASPIGAPKVVRQGISAVTSATTYGSKVIVRTIRH